MAKINRSLIRRVDTEDIERDFKPAREIYSTEFQDQIIARARLDAKDITEFLGATVPMALQRVSEMVQSDDEAIATKNSHYVIDHLIGKAVQRSHNTNTNINIDVIAD